MLNKENAIKIIEDINLPLNEYWVTSGAALVIHGVKSATNDVDLGCTTKLLEELIEAGHQYKIEDDGLRTFTMNDSVELFENWFVSKIEIVEGIPVGSIESIKKQKMLLGREKDFIDIKIIDDYIEKFLKAK